MEQTPHVLRREPAGAEYTLRLQPLLPWLRSIGRSIDCWASTRRALGRLAATASGHEGRLAALPIDVPFWVGIGWWIWISIAKAILFRNPRKEESAGFWMQSNRLKIELRETRTKETGKKGLRVTTDDIVAGISFGFWSHLLTVNFDHILWKGGISHAFPHAPAGTTRQNVHDRVDALRLWRNRIAHHYAVFDRRPTAEYQNLMEIVRWINPDMLWFMRELSNVTLVINQRPKPVPT